jgi:uncharacterized repeat protein (TIGR01451 family)
VRRLVAGRQEPRSNRRPKWFIVGAAALLIGGLLAAGALGDVAPITVTGSSASSDSPAATDSSSAPSNATASSTATSLTSSSVTYTPTIVSDKADYAPGETVTITGAGWPAQDAIVVQTDDAIGKTWSDSGNVTSDDNGNFTYIFALPNRFISDYTTTASDALGLSATTTFTDANFQASLQGQQCVLSAGACTGVGDGVWTSQQLACQPTPCTGWRELDPIPTRVLLQNGPVTAKTITVQFDHTKTQGGVTTKGFQDLTGFTHSSNVTITSGPTLNAPAGQDVWTYTFTVNLNDGNDGWVQFVSTMAAGAHYFNGSSLSLGGSPSLGNLQVHVPAAKPGNPDLTLVKTGLTAVAPGQTFTYNLAYTHAGGSTATGVQLTDVIPSTVSYVANSCSGCTVVGNTITWNLGTLSSGAAGSKTYQVTVNSTATNNTFFTNSAQILSGENDANTANNTSLVNTTVFTPAITGTVIDDTNGNGSADVGEGGLAGATISVYQDGNNDGLLNPPATDPQIGTTITTDATGDWAFTSGLAKNTRYFVVRGNPPGYQTTKAIAETVPVGTDHSTATRFSDDQINVLFDNSTGSQYSSNNQFLAKQNQAAITFDQSGIPTGGSNDTGTSQVLSVTVGATTTTYTAAQLPATVNTTNGTAVTYSYTNPVASTTTGKRYALTGVTGPASGFSASGTQSVTGSFGVQYQLSLATNPVAVGTGHISGANDGDWFDSGATVNLTADQDVANGAGSRYDFRNWSGGVPSSPNTSNPVTVTMSSARSVTANYQLQYQLSLATNPVAVGTGHISGASDGDWFDSGATVNLTADQDVANGAGSRYDFRNWSGGVPSSPNTSNPVTVTMSSARSVTANYDTQYKVSFAQSGIGTDTGSNTVVTVPSPGGNGYSKSDVDGGNAYYWVANGQTVTFAFASTVDTSPAIGKRYSLGSISGGIISGVSAITGPVTVTGNYDTQWLVGFAQSGIGSDTGSNAVVTVAGTDKTAADLASGVNVWVTDGGSVAYNYKSPVATTSSSKQYRLTGVTGPASGSAIHAAATVAGSYLTQYQVTFAQSGLGTTGANTVVAVGSSTFKKADLSDTRFWDAGTSWTYSSPVNTDPVSSTRYRLTSTASGTIGAAAAGTSITGTYVTQYAVSFVENGLASDASGTVVTVNSSAKPATNINFSSGSDPRLVFSDWIDDGTAINYMYNDPVGSTVASKQYNLQSTSGPASGFALHSATTLTGTYGDRYPTTVTNVGVWAKAPNAQPQYSDTVTLSATVNAANTSSGPLSGTVTFKLNGKPITPALTGTVSGAAPQIVTADLLLSTTIIPSGSGSYSLTADFAPASGSKYLASSGSSTAQIAKEDASLEYSGDTLKTTSTTASNSTATVNLAAVIREAADGSLGDKLSTTQLKFTVYKYSDTALTSPVASCTGNVGYTGAGMGSANCSVSTLTADNYIVKIELLTNGYYSAPVEDQAVTVVNPGTGFTTGGGWLTETSLGTRSNFGFTVKYLKNLNVQGNSLYIYRKTVGANSVVNPAGGFLPAGQYNWIIKSNAMSSLNQTCSNTTPKVCNASFEGKNNITAVNRATGLAYSLGGNYNFHVDVTDNSEPGSTPGAGPDTYTMRVWDNTTGTYYVLPGFPTQTKIDGGNIQVKP